MDIENPPDPGSGGWLAIVASVVGAGYVIVRFYRYVRKTLRSDATEANENHQKQVESEAEAATRRRREATDEAWAVVDRQNEMISGFEKKLQAVEKKCEDAIAACHHERDECQRERSRLAGVLEVLVHWAQSKGVKIPTDLLDSKTHSAIQNRLPEENE